MMVNGQMGSSLHLNAYNMNYCMVIDGHALGETATLNLIASPEMSRAYSVPENTKGGHLDRALGIEPSFSQQGPRHEPD